MQFPAKQTQQLPELVTRLQQLAAELREGLPATTQTLPAGEALFQASSPFQVAYLLEGQVNYYHNDQLLWQYEPGDILGLAPGLADFMGQWRAATPITIAAYSAEAWLAHVQQAQLAGPWTEFLLCRQSLLECLLLQLQPSAFQPSAGFIRVQAGETIIHQGDVAEHVYTLLEGRAEAYLDGVKVGDVNTQEIFGALAVFTRQPRMASVVAVTDCTLVAVRKEEFVELVEHQPQICLGVIEEMAEKIRQLNAELSDLKK